MPLADVLLLAVVQGLTEFLPVSSSGHLVIVEALLASQTDDAAKLTVNVMLHAGTLFAVLAVYWSRIWRLLGSDAGLIGKIVVGTLPAAVVGIAVKKLLPGLASQTLLTGLMLWVTGAMLLAGSRCPDGSTTYQRVTYAQALAIGTIQAIAILPGISRSGATIVAGVALGLRRDAAATFSFLLAIPVIGGASLIEARELLTHDGPSISLAVLLVGMLVAFLVGLVALRWLLRWLEQGRLHYFAWWCFPLGAAVVVWQWLG